MDKQTDTDRLAQRIQRQFNKGCVDYRLLADGDRILVALSGGKDSLMLVRLLAARARIHRPSITVEAAHVVMDNIPYETDTTWLKAFCASHGIRLHVLHAQFDETTDPRRTRCFLCARTRRRTLLSFAVDNEFNKLALGHHMDDILTTFLMNITFEGSTSTMPPLLPLDHYPVSIIRPMCLVHEELVSQLATRLDFARQKRVCPYEEVTQRAVMRQELRRLEAINPEARYSMWQAIQKHFDR